MASTFISQKLKLKTILDMPKNPPKHGDFRTLKCTLTAAEFGAVQWAAKRAGKNGGAMPLADFLRNAVLDSAREMAMHEISFGKTIPDNVGAVVYPKPQVL
jgi:hypothetical protein